MDIRTLESLQKAIPIVIRHLDSYVELAERDFSLAKSMAVSRLRLFMIIGVSSLFAIFSICVLVVALTWDGQYRVVAIGAMTAMFILVAIVSTATLSRRRDEPFAAVRREWREDRTLVKTLLANGARRSEAPAYEDGNGKSDFHRREQEEEENVMRSRP